MTGILPYKCPSCGRITQACLQVRMVEGCRRVVGGKLVRCTGCGKLYRPEYPEKVGGLLYG